MPPAERKRVAFIVPRYGADIYGGAEKLARSYAIRLVESHDVDVLTTCAREYRTWANEYPRGVSSDQGVTLRRFPVDAPRDVRRFDRISRHIHEQLQTVPLVEQESWMREQGPYSSALLAHLESAGTTYDACVFLPYLYATTYFGLPLVKDRSLLFPLAHDEWPIHLSMWDARFSQARAILYMTAPERSFVQKRFGPSIENGPICAPGIDTMPGDPLRFRQRYGITGSFALYVGRIDASKGCDALVDNFIRHKASAMFPEKLVLVGPGAPKRTTHPDVVYTGEIEEQAKWDSLEACAIFVMPSAFESLSFAILEAWSCGKPVLVNAEAAVSVAHCRASHGGLWYKNSPEFSAAIDVLQEQGDGLGKQGRDYVNKQFLWPNSMTVLKDTIEAISLPVRSTPH